MNARAHFAFLAVVLAQAAHSVEEYAFRLWEVFAPARFLSGILVDDLPVGFLILNVSFVVFGLGCWAFVVRPGKPSALALAWGWLLLEAANGFGHALIAVERGGYFPGVATAPLLIAASIWLAVETTAPGVIGPSTGGASAGGVEPTGGTG